MSTLSYRATNGNGGNTTFSIDTFSEDEIKVYVNEVLKTNGGSNLHDYTIPDYTATGGTVTWNTSGNNVAPTSSHRIRIVRQTKILNNGGNAVEGKATYSAGAAVKATDLNNNTKQALRSLQEHNDQLIQTYDIEPDGITNALIADDQIDSEHYVDGSIDHQHLSNDCIDGDNIQDDVINSEHYAPLSIDEEHLANSAVTQNKLANNSVGTPELINGSVNSDKILDGTIVNADVNASAAIAGTKISPDFGSQNIVTTGTISTGSFTTSGTVDGRDIAADGTKLDTIETNAKDDQTAAEIKTLLQSNKLTASEIAEGALDGRYFTETESDARYFNVSTGDTIKDGDTFPDNDTTIATTAAINDRIIDLVDDVGGFVPIANETSFPTTNPDINLSGSAKGGTIVSVKEASTDLTPSGTTVTIANGRGSGLAVIITGVPSTISQGFGFLVETTTTDHTYAFHRLTPKATEVTAVAGKATEIGRLGTAAAVEDMSILGTTDVVADMAILGTADVVSDMNTLGTADVVADMNTLAVTSVINNMDTVAGISGNVTTVAGIASDVTAVAADASDIGIVAADGTDIGLVAGSIGNVNNVGGSIGNVNTVANNISSVNSFANTYRIGSTNPTTSLDTGDLFFNTTSSSLKVYTGSAWVDGVTATGNFALKTGNTFTGSNIHNDNVKSTFGTGSDFDIYFNGTNARVDNKGLSGHLSIRSNNFDISKYTNGSKYIQGLNGATELYYDNSKKFETTSTGAAVTGSLGVGTTSPDFPFESEYTSANSGTFSTSLAMGSGTNANLYAAHLQNTGSGNSEVGLLFSTGNTEFGQWSINCVKTGAFVGDLAFRTRTGGTTSIERFKLKSSGDVQLVQDNLKLQLGASQDLEVYHNGTNSFIDNNTGDLYIQTTGSGDDIFIEAADDFQVSTGGETAILAVGDGEVQLYYNNAKKFQTTSTGNLFIGSIKGADNADLILGNSDDLQIFHDGTDSYINNSTGDLYIKTTGAGSDDINIIANDDVEIKTNSGDLSIKAVGGAGTNLYHNGSVKLQTTSTGVSVTGGIAATSHITLPDDVRLKVGTGEDLHIYHNQSNSVIREEGTGNLNIQTTGGNVEILTNTTETSAKFISNGAVELYHDGNKKAETYSAGLLVTGTLSVDTGNIVGNDGANLKLGTGDDLRLYHDGADSYIDEAGTGSLRIRTSQFIVRRYDNNNNMIVANSGGSVSLYHDNSSKIQTTANGINVDGRVECDRADIDGQINLQYNSGTNTNYMAAFQNNNGIMHIFRGDALYIGNNMNSSNQGSGPNNVAIKLATNGNVTATAYYGDGSNLTGISSVGGSTGVDFNDNVKARFGTGNDLEIYHDSSHSYIIDNGTGDLKLRGSEAIKLEDTSSGKPMITCTKNFGTEIYHQMNSAVATAEVKFATTSTGVTITGNALPASNNAHDLGSTSKRWANIYTNDLNLSNEGSANDVDGTWGDWTIQEGESDLFLKNNRSGKKYKFNLMEVS